MKIPNEKAISTECSYTSLMKMFLLRCRLVIRLVLYLTDLPDLGQGCWILTDKYADLVLYNDC